MDLIELQLFEFFSGQGLDLRKLLKLFGFSGSAKLIQALILNTLLQNYAGSFFETHNAKTVHYTIKRTYLLKSKKVPVYFTEPLQALLTCQDHYFYSNNFEAV